MENQDDGNIHLSHSEALRKRRSRESRESIEDVNTDSGKSTDWTLGLFGWDDPLDALFEPLSKFVSKPECLPIIVVLCTACTIGTSALVYFMNDGSALQTCKAIAPDKSQCASGLPLLSYFGAEDPAHLVYWVGGVITAVLTLGSLVYMTSAMNRLVGMFEIDFPEMTNPVNRPSCCGSGWYCGWPRHSLRMANHLQGFTGFASAMCFGGQACISTSDSSATHAILEGSFIGFAFLSIILIAKLQITLCVPPTREDVTNVFAEIPRRLQTKIVIAVLMFLVLLAFFVLAMLEYTSIVWSIVVPILQYCTLLMYLISYSTHFQDIRTSGIQWRDYNFMKQKRSRPVNEVPVVAVKEAGPARADVLVFPNVLSTDEENHLASAAPACQPRISMCFQLNSEAAEDLSARDTDVPLANPSDGGESNLNRGAHHTDVTIGNYDDFMAPCVTNLEDIDNHADGGDNQGCGSSNDCTIQ